MQAIGENLGVDMERVLAHGVGVPTLDDRSLMDDRAFSRVLGLEMNEGQKRGVDEGREAARDLVATAFITPLLKMIRSDPFKSDLFHGGQGEEAFGAMLDQSIAPGLADQVAPGLVDSIYAKLVGRMGSAGGEKTDEGLDATA